MMDAPTPTHDLPGASSRRPVRILLVEDNPADVVFTRQVLRRRGVDVDLMVACDGEAALVVLTGPDRPDLVLLDLNMPRLDGLEVLERVKGDPALAAIPVIVMTSSVAAEDVDRAYQRHVNAYIPKPADLGELTRIIAAIDDFWCTVAVLPGRDPLGSRP